MFPNDRVNDAPDNMMTTESAKELMNEFEGRVEELIYEVNARITDQLNESLEVSGEELGSWLDKLKKSINPLPSTNAPVGKEGKTEKENMVE